MGRKRPRAKTKNVLKPVNQMKQLAGMPKTKKLKNLNKNHPTGHRQVPHLTNHDHSLQSSSSRGSWSLFFRTLWGTPTIHNDVGHCLGLTCQPFQTVGRTSSNEQHCPAPGAPSVAVIILTHSSKLAAKSDDEAALGGLTTVTARAVSSLLVHKGIINQDVCGAAVTARYEASWLPHWPKPSMHCCLIGCIPKTI